MTLATSTFPQSPLLYAKLTMASFLWGGTFVAGRLLAADMSPLLAATGRFALAALVLLFLLLKSERRLPRLTWSQVLLMCLLGATGVCLYNIFFFAAVCSDACLSHCPLCGVQSDCRGADHGLADTSLATTQAVGRDRRCAHRRTDRDQSGRTLQA